MAGEESSQPPQSSIASTEAPQMVSSMKLPILKKGEYILWTMKMEQYLAYTYYALWELDKKDLEQIDQDDLEEMNFNDRDSAKNSRNRSRDAENVGYRERDNGKRPAKKEDKQALVVQDGLEEEVTETVFDNRSSDEENSVANDRFKKGEGYHAVPPPLTVNYMPSKPNLLFAELDDSIYKFKISETVTSLAKDEKDTPETSTACVENPKEDRSSAPLIEDWETNSDDDSVFTPEPIPAKIDFVKAGESVKHVKPIKFFKHVKHVTPVKTAHKLKNPRILVQVLKMAKKSVLPTNAGKGTGHMESRLIWNNVQRINHQNKFAPTTVFTRSSRIPVSAAKPKAAVSTSAAKPVNTVGPKQSVNFSRTRSTFHKSNSPIRSFYNATTHSRRNSSERVNTAGSRAVSAVKGNGGHPQQALKNKGIVDSGCSRHMRGNKAYLADYQKIYDGGFVVFCSSRGKITGDVTCLFAKASIDESNLWHRRLGHVNFKTMNKLVKGNLMLHMDLFGLTSVMSVNHKKYCLVVTDDFTRALVTKTHNKTPYELLNGRSPGLDFMRPFGCPITILNNLNPFGKFEGKADEGFLVGNAGTQDNVDARKEVSDQHYIMLPLWSSISSTSKSSNDKPGDDKPKDDIGSKTVEEPVNKEDQAYRDELDRIMSQAKEASDAADAFRKDNPVNAASISGTFSAGGPLSPHPDAFIPANTLLHIDQDDSQILYLEETTELQSTGIFNSAYDDDLDIYTSLVQSEGAEADFNNMESSTIFNPIPIHKKVWRLVDMPYGKKVIGTKWEYKNMKDERGIVVRNKARLSAFLYGIIEEEVYVSQPPGFIDSQFLYKVYKVEKALYGLHKLPEPSMRLYLL
nr:retrotransposon protein, putative, unclassified [Tanacetum cinerariifolium]